MWVQYNKSDFVSSFQYSTMMHISFPKIKKIYIVLLANSDGHFLGLTFIVCPSWGVTYASRAQDHTRQYRRGLTQIAFERGENSIQDPKVKIAPWFNV